MKYGWLPGLIWCCTALLISCIDPVYHTEYDFIRPTYEPMTEKVLNHISHYVFDKPLPPKLQNDVVTFAKVVLHYIETIQENYFRKLDFEQLFQLAVEGVQSNTERNEAESEKSTAVEGADGRKIETLAEMFVDNYVKTKRKVGLDSEILLQTINNVTSSLDEFSRIYSKVELQEMSGTGEGVAGIGVSIRKYRDSNLIGIVEAFSGSISERSGIQAGDIIASIDGVSMENVKLDRAIGMLRGKPNSKVTVKILRNSKLLDFELVREAKTYPSVYTTVIDQHYLYVKIRTLAKNSANHVRAALDQFLVDNSEPIGGIVLDLRYNSGGSINSAVAVADIFIDSGVIVQTKGRARNTNLRFKATPNSLPVKNIPLLVLVNGETAAGAEVVAHALRYHNNAVIFGSRTFGHGLIYTIINMDGGVALKLTTGRLILVDNQPLSETGLLPDYCIIVNPLESVVIAKEKKQCDKKTVTPQLEKKELALALSVLKR